MTIANTTFPIVCRPLLIEEKLPIAFNLPTFRCNLMHLILEETSFRKLNFLFGKYLNTAAVEESDV